MLLSISGEWPGQFWSTLFFFAMKNVKLEMEVWHGTPSCYIIRPHLWLGMFIVAKIFWYFSLLKFPSALHICYTPLTVSYTPHTKYSSAPLFFIINLYCCLVDLGSPLVPTGLLWYLRRLWCRANGPGDQLEPMGILNIYPNTVWFGDRK